MLSELNRPELQHRALDFVVFESVHHKSALFVHYLIAAALQSQAVTNQLLESSIMANLNKDGVEKVCQQAQRLNGHALKQTTKAEQILQQVSGDQGAPIYAYLAQQLRLSLHEKDPQKAKKTVMETAKLLEALCEENEEQFWNALNSGGHESGIVRGKALGIVVESVIK